MLLTIITAQMMRIGGEGANYRVRQIKVIPCRALLISQQRIRILTRKFTRLFIIHIYV